MNELFILGELMEGAENGYNLRNALEASLGRNRKLSFGVLYPLLKKMENNGLIFIEEVKKGRTQKVAAITEKGRLRFFELMRAPVPKGAKSKDIYMIKLDVMQHLTETEQKELLTQFIQEQQVTIDETKSTLKKLSKEDSKDHWYAARKFSLRLLESELSVDWANDFMNNLPYK